MAFIVGLTGGIASGKSTVSKLLEERGFAIVDADIAARKVVEPEEKAYREIVETFGNEILLEDGSLDRARLGSIVFQNEEERKKLNGIVHPAVRKKMKDWQAEAVEAGKQTVILDIPLLYESKLTHLVEKTIVVFVNKETQLERLMERNAFTEEEAISRIASQMPLQEKVKMADAVIDNNGSMEETERQLEQLIEKWKMKP
ncbi:dephospho-CoA kinase [Siminovitchia terrae]|uniref:Dephospho-CoA kinase n=1 Tax=Siminovitchia terrae TaxID=1914933 RepID=A0ABQ4L2W2_SIMTE|nr:dephospho-CoA kinase [Siminovitchia terrae]GIN91790.1 dephospho-CoA kinase [Siminovitchia terrae]GIN98603.1 dephospho-CoA kinase [Siminovitchia terrae]